jgi:arylsulfatase A-like enzyme
MISDVLSSAGYNCGYVGKWHMGSDQRPGHGYRYTYTMIGGSRSLADVNAMVAVLTEFIKADVCLRNNYDPQDFENELRKKQLEFQTAFRKAAVDRLSQDGFDSDSGSDSTVN